MMKRILSLFVLFFFANHADAQFYYGSQQEFGKNRVQYQPFNWTYYGFDRYQVYLYEGGQELAKYVAHKTELHLKDLEKKLDFQFEEKIQILVYTNQGDFRQSNIGLSAEDGSGGNLGGVTKIAGTKVAVYFKGNHADLDKQIRAGVAEVLINDMMYGGRARDMVKNSTLLVLPDWYKKGLISYLSEDWSVELDNKVMDAVLNDRYYSFNKLSGEEAVMAGHALWNYIADTYGMASIPNILYMTKVSRSVESAFNFVLGTSVQTITYEWIDAYARRNMNIDSTQYFPKGELVLEKPKTFRNYYQLKISNDGKYVAYVSNELSQYRVYIKNMDEKSKPKRIAKWGPKIERINDFSYPLLAWNPKGNSLAMINEKKGVIYFSTYNVEEKETFTKPITGIEKVIDFGYSPDGKKIVFSGVKKGKGQADIFIFTINAGGLEQITNDVWDDNYPRFVNKGNQILFTSNRVKDTITDKDNARYEYMQSKYNDLFMYDVQKKSKALLRITNTPDVNESQPMDYESGYFSYLSESNGIRNRFLAKMDSVISYVDTTEHYRYTFYPKIVTNYKRNVQEQDISFKGKKITEVFYMNGRQYMYISPMPEAASAKVYELQNNHYRRTLLYSPKSRVSQSQIVSPGDTKTAGADSGKVNVEDYSFKKVEIKVTQIKENTADHAIDTLKQKPTGPQEFRLPTLRNYYVNFSVDNIVTQLDNSFLSQTYQRFSGSYINPGFNGFFKIGMSDLFEDYRIIAGFRLTTGLNTEMFVSVENKKKLLDKQLILHRQTFYNIEGGNELLKMNIHDAQYKLKIPFNEVLALRGTFLYRNDRKVFTATNDATLLKKNQYDNYVGAKAELIFDNTKSLGLNLYRGNRSKLFAEYLRRIDIKDIMQRHDLIVMGFDLRNYTRIHRNFIWANRLAGSTSLGTDRLIYYLGGVDNWFSPKFDYNINILHPEQYQFQTIATNMRGFKQNARNGNNFVAFNSELRFPIFNYLINRPIRSDFINNFQIIGFSDFGMAWYGWNPYSAENTENRTTIPGNPINVVLIQYKQPIIAGYGFGIRSRLFGYFFRVDMSWGIDNKEKQDRITYLSFTTDF
ncbi:MAG: hypothetical protein K0S33_2047 [Bacteroidetes bacterium]|jgi:hypothetical protein|nr:hypothetical protein [Bacteroidota bacterium]